MKGSDRPGTKSLPASIFVWGTWGLMLAAALGFVVHYGSNVPSWDDWDIVPTLTAEQPITTTWLWSQHNEHRVPLPRLVLLALYKLTVADFRAVMFFNMLLLGSLALTMILVAKEVRGEVSYSDAFFPLLLLHWGQASNFLWAWQFQFIASTILTCIVLLMIVKIGTRYKSKTMAIMIGAVLLLLPLCGANGIALVPALALWLLYFAVLHRHSGEPHGARDSILMFGLAFSALLLVVLYFIGFESVPYHPKSPSVPATLNTAAQFFTIGFGPATRAIWPWSGLGVLSLLLLSAVVLVIVWRYQPRERLRASGLFLFLGAMTSLALGLGLGRDGFETRYVTLAIPLWCCVYYVMTIYSPSKINFAVRTLLLVVASLSLWPNTRLGITYAADLRHHLASFERDMTVGVPGHQLISRYGSYLHIHHDVLLDYMPMLRRAGVGKFPYLKDDPPFKQVSVPLAPTLLNQVRWEASTAYGTGYYPYLVFDLQEDRYVSGVRLRYSYSNENGTLPYVSIYWKRRDQHDFDKQQFWKYSPTGDRANWTRGTWLRVADPETTLTVWVCDTLGQLRIHPDFKPGIFKISEITLLVPANE